MLGQRARAHRQAKTRTHGCSCRRRARAHHDAGARGRDCHQRHRAGTVPQRRGADRGEVLPPALGARRLGTREILPDRRHRAVVRRGQPRDLRPPRRPGQVWWSPHRTERSRGCPAAPRGGGAVRRGQARGSDFQSRVLDCVGLARSRSAPGLRGRDLRVGARQPTSHPLPERDCRGPVVPPGPRWEGGQAGAAGSAGVGRKSVRGARQRQLGRHHHLALVGAAGGLVLVLEVGRARPNLGRRHARCLERLWWRRWPRRRRPRPPPRARRLPGHQLDLAHARLRQRVAARAGHLSFVRPWHSLHDFRARVQLQHTARWAVLQQRAGHARRGRGKERHARLSSHDRR